MIPGLKSLVREVDDLRAQFPPEPTQEELEREAWLDSFTHEQIFAVGEILLKHSGLYGPELLAALNAAEYALLESILLDHRPVNIPTEEEPRDCKHCDFGLHGDAMKLRHADCWRLSGEDDP